MPGGGASVPISPLIVAGMHRSGVALVASWLAAAGIDMGEGGGELSNDAAIEIDARALRTVSPAGEAGIPEWGWTPSERLAAEAFGAGAAGSFKGNREGHFGSARSDMSALKARRQRRQRCFE